MRSDLGGSTRMGGGEEGMGGGEEGMASRLSLRQLNILGKMLFLVYNGGSQ